MLQFNLATPSFLNTIFLVFIFSSTHAWSSDVDDLLSAKQAPAGVVFEIVSGDSGLLSTLLPDVKIDIERLRERFPDIPIAIVTHGSEQFDLTIKNREKESKAHNLVENLVKSDNVDVHVCGTHASWFNVAPEDFPDYVDVTPAGPTQINNYEEIGYEVIVLP